MDVLGLRIVSNSYFGDFMNNLLFIKFINSLVIFTYYSLIFIHKPNYTALSPQVGRNIHISL